MPRVLLRPDRLRQFGVQDARSFYLIGTPELLADVDVAPAVRYRDHVLVPLDERAHIEDVLAETIPDGAHVLVIAPGRVITSPERIGNRKLAVLPCGSTDSSLESIAASLAASEDTDPSAQETRAETFFREAGRAAHLEIVDDEYGTFAVFDHIDPTYVWNAQLGFVGWGEQQILPAGEISVLPADIMTFDPARRLALSGSLAFTGEPIVHRGSATPETTGHSALYGTLCSLRRSAVIAEIDDGVIRALRPASARSSDAAEALDALLLRDERYAIVWEIGVGINDRLIPVPENCATNEVYGSDGGRVHIGIGLTSVTEYALTFPCNGSVLRTPAGVRLAGNAHPPARPQLRITRNARAECGCTG